MQSQDDDLPSRLHRLERLMSDSVSRLDRLHHLVELLLDETHARRRAESMQTGIGTGWSDAGFPVLPRNRPVDFGSERVYEDLDPDDFLASGWHVREPWGVWGDNVMQALRFALEDYRGGYVMVNLGLQCFVPPDAARPAIDIVANGYFLGSYTLGCDIQMVKLRLPPSCIGTGDIILQLQHESAISPMACGLASDDRILGVGLATLDAA